MNHSIAEIVGSIVKKYFAVKSGRAHFLGFAKPRKSFKGGLSALESAVSKCCLQRCSPAFDAPKQSLKREKAKKITPPTK